MIHVGIQLKQLNSGFITHFPHLESSARKAWNNSDQLKNQGQLRRTNGMAHKRRQVDVLYVKFKDWLSTHIPDTRRMSICTNNKQ